MTDVTTEIFIGVLAFFSFGLLLIEFLRYWGKRRYTFTQRDADASVLVIVPCRGLDLTLRENIESLKHQKYQKYSLVAVVDDEHDAATQILREEGVTVIFSDAECSGCSGKVRAIATALEHYPDYDFYVIADSDATYPEDWLASLLRPLSDSTCGISTTFPVFTPLSGFWSKVKMVWGFIGMSMMDSPVTRFGWGGSLAFRRELLDDGGIDYFKESVSDDGALTHLCTGRKLRIAYVDNITVKIYSKETFNSFIEWSNRQTALAILGNGMLLPFGLAYFSVRSFVLYSSIAVSILISPILLLLLAPFAINLYRIYRRARSHDPTLLLIFLFNDLLYLSNLIAASRMKTINWRGRTYQLR